MTKREKQYHQFIAKYKKWRKDPMYYIQNYLCAMSKLQALIDKELNKELNK